MPNTADKTAILEIKYDYVISTSHSRYIRLTIGTAGVYFFASKPWSYFFSVKYDVMESATI